MKQPRIAVRGYREETKARSGDPSLLFLRVFLRQYCSCDKIKFRLSLSLKVIVYEFKLTFLRVWCKISGGYR